MFKMLGRILVRQIQDLITVEVTNQVEAARTEGFDEGYGQAVVDLIEGLGELEDKIHPEDEEDEHSAIKIDVLRKIKDQVMRSIAFDDSGWG